MNKRNYQKEMESVIKTHEKGEQVPSLFLHSCCGPCSSYVLEYLSEFFCITLYYYNPNIDPPEEYRFRAREQELVIEKIKTQNPVLFLEGEYEPECFYRAVKGLEREAEGGKRCQTCFELRLESAAKKAAEGGFDYFTTTLSISPLKSADRLNEIGEEMGRRYGVAYLVSDFKKKDGYKRSVALSQEMGLYRQNYCGCVYSRNRE